MKFLIIWFFGFAFTFFGPCICIESFSFCDDNCITWVQVKRWSPGDMKKYKPYLKLISRSVPMAREGGDNLLARIPSTEKSKITSTT